MATENVRSGGGPFAALVVRDGRVVGRGTNQVTVGHDPTAHAEVMAIRSACAELQTHQLTGCAIYTSCEPCPMCLGAIYWARPDRVVYAASRFDAADVGFDDEFIYEELARPPGERRIPVEQAAGVDAKEPFRTWAAFEARTPY